MKNPANLAIKTVKALTAVLKQSTLSLERETPRQVVIEINQNIRLRTLRHILILFGLSDYRIFLRAHVKRWVISFANSLVWHPETKLLWRNPEPSGEVVLCTDSSQTNELTIKDQCANKIIHLHFDYAPSLELPSAHFALPYPMHTQIYLEYHAHQRLENYRTTQKKVKLFFAGNSDEAAYNNPIISESFGKLTRYKIVNFLKTNNLATIIRSRSELDSVLSNTYRNNLIIVDTSLFRVDQECWLKLIAQADFFLCPPGIAMPMCHNAIEAMAVGTIPFLNYPDWFFPNLIHFENCISFSSLSSLEKELVTILQMSDDQLDFLRKNVKNYYTNHLCQTKFLERILLTPDKHLHLHVLNENTDSLTPKTLSH